MRKCTCLLVPLLSLAFCAMAQQADLPSAQTQGEHSPRRENRVTVAPACKNLEKLSTTVEQYFEILDTKSHEPMPMDEDGSTWDSLIDCANQTHSPSQRTEALRVAAMWEHLRAEGFREMYIREVALLSSVTMNANAPSSVTQTSIQEENPLVQSLQKAQASIDAELEMERRAATEKAQREAVVQVRRKTMANPSVLVTIRAGERLQDEEIARIAAHNRAVCDQIITVAGLTPSGLALYVPPLGQKFMAKNSKNYPRMCLVEDTDYIVLGVPRYLLVYAYSEGSFSGFQPIKQSRNIPVYGSGTATNAYGGTWNFTYHGTMTEIETVQAPYVIQSHSLYLHAYDDNGHVVSQHSMTTSSQTGGDASWAAGYNGAQLIALLWNNPSRLIKSVLSDVQKDSKK
jgi:hypothetical protein